MGRDALLRNDQVSAEAFFQHAEHYVRLLATAPGRADENGEASPSAEQG